MSPVPKVDLFTICRGAAYQLFQNALEKINANIKDPNTAAEKKRKISLHFEFTPYLDRSGAEVVCTVENKIAGILGVNSSIYLKKAEGVVEAFTQDVSQLDLFEGETEETPKAKV
jgi:hypothetical protein